MRRPRLRRRCTDEDAPPHRVARGRHELRSRRDRRAARGERGAVGARRRAGGGCRLRARAFAFRSGQRPLPPQRCRRPVDPGRPPAARGARSRAPRTGGHRRPLRSNGAPGTGGRRLRPFLRAARGARGPLGGRLARRHVDRARPAERPREARTGLVRRPRRNRQGLRSRTRARSHARGLAGSCRWTRRPRRRHRSSRRVAGRRPVADRGRRPAPSGRDARGPCAGPRGSRHLGPRRAAVRPCRLAPPPDRPRDRRVGARRAAHGHGRRPGSSCRRDPRHDACDRRGRRSRGARRRAAADLGALCAATRSRSPARPAAARLGAARSERRMTTALPVAWLVARAAGLVAFGLLTLSVWLGLAMSTRVLGPKWAKQLLGLHRTLAWTGLAMIGLHIGAILLDPVLHFGVLGALVPGAAPWRPGAVAMGVVAGWLTLALAASFNARRWIGQKGWRRLHYATFVAFWLALGHALLVGTDLKGFGGPVTAVLAAAPVLWLSFYRLLVPLARSVPTRSAPPLAAA